MKKKLISMLLVSCMLLTSAPMTALAAEVEFSDSAEDYENPDEFTAEFTEMQEEPETDFEMGGGIELFSDEEVAEAFVSDETAEAGLAAGDAVITIGDIIVSENNKDAVLGDGNTTVTYETEANSLVLNGAVLTEPIVSTGDLNIVLAEGSENSITVNDFINDVYGAMHASGNINIEGNGTLKLLSPSCGIWSEKIITIDGVVVDAESTSSDHGIFSRQGINIVNEADVKATGIDSYTEDEYYCNGIFTWGAINIDKSVVNATGSSVGVMGYDITIANESDIKSSVGTLSDGIYAENSLSIVNSKVTAEGESNGIFSSGTVTISEGADVTTIGRNDKAQGYGVYGKTKIIINGAKVLASGGKAGVFSGNSPEINSSIEILGGADVTAKGTDSRITRSSYGIFGRNSVKIEQSKVVAESYGYGIAGAENIGIINIKGSSVTAMGTGKVATMTGAFMKTVNQINLLDEMVALTLGNSETTAVQAIYVNTALPDVWYTKKYAKIEPAYSITVINGTASVLDITTEGAIKDVQVTITADSAEAGKRFKEWSVTGDNVSLADKNSTTTTFTMPGEPVTITAVYEDAPYNITVTKGTAKDSNGTAITQAVAGTLVTITANPASYDYTFNKWVVESGGITLANPYSRTTTFNMPMGNVSVKATYYYDPYIPPTPSPTPTPDPIPENFPEGSERNPDGTISTPNGTVVDKDGTITLPDGTELKPDEDGNKPTIDKDNNVTDTNGTVIDKDGNITLPGKDLESKEDDTKVETGTGSKPPKYDPETGKVTTEDGNKVTLPGGQEITPPAGSVVEQDGTITEPDGTIITPDGTITKPDGTVIDPDGTIHNPDGSIQSADGSYLRPATPMLDRAEIGTSGNQVKAILSGECAGAEGYDYVISENINCIVDKDYLARSRNILKTNTAFYYIPAGTYYVYCHAYTRDENGKKVFSKWSNYRMVTVTAITPEIPEITDVRVKGSNVIVTYTNCENADGYDIILGRAYRTVNGEKRPVDYIPHVRKIKNSDTTTVIFRNVPKGRYFAGLHAWNRTSEDGKKVFSPWSKSRRIIVK